MYAILASLGVHLLLVLIAQYWPELATDPKQDIPLEIDFRTTQNQTLEMAPAQNQAKKVEKQPKDEARFKSSQTQRTDLEQFRPPQPSREFTTNVALPNGGNKGQGQEQEPDGKAQEERAQAQEILDETGEMLADGRKRLQLPGFSGAAGQAQIPQSVQESLPPGVRLGNITSLNTDQHRYYSFNQRLLSRFVPLWGRQVRSALYQWLEENNYPHVGKVWVTNVEIILDPNGEIIEVQPFRLSSTWSIDKAAIDSFKQMRQVPNPPKEMVDENGYIHLQFQTEVYWVPQPGARYHGGGPGR